jgi:transposase
MAELGIIAPQGREGLKELLAIVTKDANTHLPNDARASLIVLAAQLHALQTTIGALEKRIVVQHRANKDSKRLQTIPGIGPLGASAIAATVTYPKIFRSGRDFAAWIGLVSRQMSTGGKSKLGPISKQLQALAELVRNLILACVLAFLVSRLDVNSVASACSLALALWVGFPLILLTGSVMYEKVPWKLAAIHAGDWLIKLVLIMSILALWQ